MRPSDPGAPEKYLANRPECRLTSYMKSIRLSEICDEVARQKQPVVLTKRGKALVRIEPVEEGTDSEIWDLAELYRKKTGPIKETLPLPKRIVETPKTLANTARPSSSRLKYGESFD